MKAVLIIHDTSGDKTPNSEKIPEITELLNAGGVEIEVHSTREDLGADAIAKKAVQDGAECVIVGGGDGTVGMVARELVGSKTTLGIIPLGTYNNIARSARISTDLAEACWIITSRHRRDIDVGVLNGERYFFEALGAGLDAELFPAGEAVKDGNWLALLDVVRTVAEFQPVDMEITFDCPLEEAILPEQLERLSAEDRKSNIFRCKPLFVVAANGRYYGSGLHVSPKAQLADSRLTVSIYSDFTKTELIAHFVAMLQGQDVDTSHVQSFRASEIKITAAKSVPVHADGERWGETPATVTVLPGALQLWAPPSEDEAS